MVGTLCLTDVTVGLSRVGWINDRYSRGSCSHRFPVFVLSWVGHLQTPAIYLLFQHKSDIWKVHRKWKWKFDCFINTDYECLSAVPMNHPATSPRCIQLLVADGYWWFLLPFPPFNVRTSSASWVTFCVFAASEPRKLSKTCSHDNLQPALATWSVREYPSVCVCVWKGGREIDSWCGWKQFQMKHRETWTYCKCEVYVWVRGDRGYSQCRVFLAR